ncbi:MAG: DNA translocase FtsK 4TM domain-containing protein [Elusimicrobia bacterium]|nr:DNA translocase FtsK 4TM domain-containing protein [Elusimicrobiota bacterium]
MRRNYAKGSRSKTARQAFSALRSLLFLSLVLYVSWAVLFPSPDWSGRIGAELHAALRSSIGLAIYGLPLFLVHLWLRWLRSPKAGGWITTAAAETVALFATCSVLAFVEAGGSWGAAIERRISAALGPVGALGLSSAALLLALQLLFGIQWSKLASRLIRLLVEDFQSWRRSRKELEARWEAISASTSFPVAKPPAVSASSAENRPAVPPVPAPTPPAAPARRIQANGRQEARASAPAGSAFAHYKHAPLSLLREPPPAKDRGKPSEAEIQSSIEALERTLKSFGVEAAVTGYAPGPVITRFELAPAPGVKVSSIVALENDIALALKAKGIRIIAPIPGKAAVGIEIPNARPALVVLRDILESPAMPLEAPLLSFALGLSAAGEPMSADLQKMPHLLVAGATNSGKSVCLHALILSMLFRARPDEVKFMMIDPKRLELTFYDGIPHLFDPTSPADKVSVITNPKEAAKSLGALVKLMERRYEKFQLFGVRNIDSYNREADKRGHPREFFIVVVIDELADLMLVAQDKVEDSIQRLTQMARAVGIHLVLATQRPSVDVITGVIKANLPCRIALQVISKVDSKVILDGVGAESLQGRGDMLYLAAGAQKPERCQGAYVSEEETTRIAEYLRSQGKPDYPMLETMAKAAETDLSSYGVEPLEFSQALKLVLERRRVSQDLLKAQFGSSARATNLLSLLEIKEMIHKPEGSNRWEIHFDAIEDYLRKNFPQVPIDGK